ncbi:hypothetical protein BJD55_gp080 [Gordonia phage Yvonnetastic]|uniref:Uncharacterized protein n=1 Tax=Gordonia phage Yvonnetastic TaxID=1821566 RepID=A0A142K9A3_9CAUD|nr:hypothetical protein BJD55_gp080 [Gordonia phage Yvonnetastic]AMS02686.1 hypothetical protein SEA_YVONNETASTIC_142 [Gordonia phage Yvonnetastic]WKW86119.1 hypothetical protein SEA_JONJAMES_145 [Gordonia Phage JonJames]
MPEYIVEYEVTVVDHRSVHIHYAEDEKDAVEKAYEYAESFAELNGVHYDELGVTAVTELTV